MRALIATLACGFLLALTACSASIASIASIASLPSTRALENGAAGSLNTAKSFEITGTYTDASAQWSIDLQVVRPDTERVTINGPTKLESIVIGDTAYFRGHEFLAQNMGTDPVSVQKVLAAGNSWWKGRLSDALRLPDFTDGTAFQSTFLGAVASRRTDNLSVDGNPAVELSGVRADVYIAGVPPYRLLSVRLHKDVVIDGVSGADLRFVNFDRDFGIAAPTNVIDFSDLSTLPPIYYVVSIDTSGCSSPCALSAVLKNLGGRSSASGPSSVTFTVSDAASGRTVGSCIAHVVPDVGFNETTTAGCTIDQLNGQQLNAGVVTVNVDNPGRA